MLRSTLAVRPVQTVLRRFKTTVPSVDSGNTVDLNQPQAPNRELTWSKNQRPWSTILNDPRFEQTDLTKQPRPKAAIELIKEIPVIQVEKRIAVCNGGGGALGHPRVYINLDDGQVQTCGYCGLRFQQSHHHHH
jgi:NADH dehydrogenase (ubiquinone) Fe-S protein 6